MKLKAWLSILLVTVLLCAMLPFSAAAEPLTVSATSYNSSRGTGELVVYTAEYGDTTGTNWWGAEVTVGPDNVVKMISNGNSDIPADGFVLSGHDDETDGGSRMKTWILEHIQVGDYVYFDKRTLQVTVSDEPIEVTAEVFYEVSREFNSINGTREEDSLVIYTPLKGATTGTNTYGYEVVVDNGAVVTRGGNDSAIPAKGFVVSGHGTMVTWLRTSVIDGMRAEYDKDEGVVRFIYDAESLKTAVSSALEDTQTAIEDAKAAFIYADYALAEEAVTTVSASYENALKIYENGGTDAAFADACDTVLQELTAIQNGLCDSYPVQYRGVWVRPSQRTAAEVQEFVKELHDAGINTVCVEGWFANGVIMEVPEDSLFEKHPDFSYDVLQAYIDACHEYEMECHLWMPIMNIGSSIDSGYERSVPGKKPEWLSLSNEGTPDNPDGFMMIDPANEEAREYLVSFYEYLVTAYDIDCFELDYIRYYASGELDFGYTEAAFKGFEEQYGYGVTPTYDTGAAYWDDWSQYRRDCVTEMVKAVREMIDRVAPEVLLSADVAPTPEDACEKNYQDYPRWLEEGLLDMLHPMAYGDGYGEDITQAVELGGDTCIVATGLGVMTDSLNAPEMERQAREDNSYGTYGDYYFEANSFFGDKAYEALNATVYRNAALAPFLNPNASIVKLLEYMQGRIDDVLLPLSGITETEAAALTEAITAASAAVENSRIAAEQLTALHEAVEAVENEQARAVLGSDLYRAERISCVAYHLTTEELLDEASFNDAPSVWVIVLIGAVLSAAVLCGVVLLFIKRRAKISE